MDVKLNISDAGIWLIQYLEGGPKLKPYVDTAGNKTYGVGHLLKKDKEGNVIDADILKVTGKKEPEVLTAEQAEELFKLDLKVFEDELNGVLSAPIEQEEFDALMSFSYNCGLGKRVRDAIIKRINNHDFEEVPDKMLDWCIAGGKKDVGLLKRRHIERLIFMNPTIDSAYEELSERLAHEVINVVADYKAMLAREMSNSGPSI